MNNTLLIIAGCVGASVAIIHGYLMQKHMIEPLLQSNYGAKLSEQSRRLIPALLHFSTVCWFLGGIFLIAAPFFFDDTQRVVGTIVVGGFYTFGAIGNLWGTRGRHPGWVMLTIAVVLIIASL